MVCHTMCRAASISLAFPHITDSGLKGSFNDDILRSVLASINSRSLTPKRRFGLGGNPSRISRRQHIPF